MHCVRRVIKSRQMRGLVQDELVQPKDELDIVVKLSFVVAVKLSFVVELNPDLVSVMKLNLD